MVAAMAETDQTDARWPMSLIRRGAKVPDDGTRWWQELPEGHSADGIRSLGYEVVTVAPAREIEEEVEPALVEGRDRATSLRLYLSVAGEEDLEEVSDRIADVLLELGFNGGESLDAVIACVPESPDVIAFSDGAKPFFEAVKDDSAFILIPSAGDGDDVDDDASAPEAD